MIEIVDSADIDQRIIILPREISRVTSSHIGEMELCGIHECNKKNKNEQLSRTPST
jgi:hypothetical protein